MNINLSRALLLLAALGLSACGGGGSGSSAAPNTAPTANFASVCADLVCTFTNISTDPDVGDTLSAISWTFGDATAAVATRDANHTFALAGTYDVTLTVTDRFGAQGTRPVKITVTAPASSGPVPHASFTASCQSLDCTFKDTSAYDPGSTPQSRVWDFGDGVTLTASSPTTHRYAATTLTTFSIKLTVTDAAGKISTSTQSLPVAPAASTANCVGGGCSLQLLQASTVTATLVSSSCAAHGNVFSITAPVVQTIFADGCYDLVGSSVPLNGGQRFAANTVLAAQVVSGLSGTTGLAYLPSIRVTGDFANGWTLIFDDGYGGPGEPDFNDLIILIKATP